MRKIEILAIITSAVSIIKVIVGIASEIATYSQRKRLYYSPDGEYTKQLLT